MRADLLTYLEKTNREFGPTRTESRPGFRIVPFIQQGKPVGTKVIKEEEEEDEGND